MKQAPEYIEENSYWEDRKVLDHSLPLSYIMYYIN